MREGWNQVFLNQIAENLDSRRVPITKNKRSVGNIPYYGASGIVDYVEDYIFDDELLLVSEDGANLLMRNYPIAFSISGRSWVNNHAHVLRFAEGTTQKYVEYYLNSISLREYVSGMAQPKLNQAMLNRIPIPLPPLEEQQQIVAILDEAFAAIDQAKANAEKNLQNAKELFESYLNTFLFSTTEEWEDCFINEVCELKSGTTIPKQLEKSHGDVLYVKVADMNLPGNETHIQTSSRFVAEDAINLGQIVPIGSVIFPKRGGAIATNKKRIIVKPTIVDLNTMALVPTERIDSEFLYNWFQTIDLNTISNGTSIPQINNYSFDNVSIRFPKSRKEQQRISRDLNELRDQASTLAAIYGNKLKLLEQLKQSILQKAFAGELTTKAVEELV